MSSTNRPLRLRVFAGPNGSGKSTIIKAVKDHKVKGIPVDFGIYVNADDIAKELRADKFPFPSVIKFNEQEFINRALSSGLVNKKFSKATFLRSFRSHNHFIAANSPSHIDRLAQIVADYMRYELLQQRRKFSFETVFSHDSKLDIMRQAAAAGYKVYLYFVCTESPEINKYRVKEVRLKEGGHDVPEDKIESRYYRSLDYLFEAAQIAHQVYFFDNSGDEFRAFAHFKIVNGEKLWDPIEETQVPEWFRNYYSAKVK